MALVDVNPESVTVLPVPKFLSANKPVAVPVRLTLSLLTMLLNEKVGVTEKPAVVVPSYSRLCAVPAVGVRVRGRAVMVTLPLL